MRYIMLMAATAVLASTSIATAKTRHYPPQPVQPGYSSTLPAGVPAGLSFEEQRRYFDPCHCDGGAP
jgi:hypothetical protein